MSPEYTPYIFIFLGYTNYFIITSIYHSLSLMNIADTMGSKRKINLLNLRHALGIFFFGLLFLPLISKYTFLFNLFTGFDSNIGFLTMLIIFLCITIAYKMANNQNVISTFNKAHKTSRIQYLIIRILFLFAYEFFFRGILFFTVLEHSNLLTSILINTSAYALIHKFDSRKEFLGCIPFGIILCLLCYFSNSIWPAFLIHTSLSFTYESIILRKTILKTEQV